MITDRDKALLANLREQGVNMEGLRSIQFYLYFPVEPAAKGAAMRAREQGYKTALVDAGEGVAQRWTLTVTKSIAPTEINIARANDFLSRLAKQHSGAYDGWSLAQ